MLTPASLDGAECGSQSGIVFTLITSEDENVIHVAQYYTYVSVGIALIQR